MKKIGIMGGTFNPIHNAHLAMAEAAYEQYTLDEVWFMPSKNPPHKEKSEIVSDDHRKRMIQFAIDGIPHFSFSDFELKREGTTYTCETLEGLRKRYPDTVFYFIMGGDSLFAFHTWYRPEKIAAQCVILAAPREDATWEKWCDICREKSIEFQGDIRPLKLGFLNISSEAVRNKIRNGGSAAGLCPDKVRCYIQLHQFYVEQPQRKPEIADSILVCLSSTLRPKRYEHTLGVANTASNLAFFHGDEHIQEQAYLAGLLHDCAKYYTGKEQLALCEQYQIPFTDIEAENTALVHAKLGACLAKERYGVTDSEILSAIACHTTGKPNMTMLEKILYIADYIEPNRKMETSPYSLAEIRKTCYKDLDGGLYMILTCTVSHLKKSGLKTDALTKESYEYYKKYLKNKKTK